MRILYDGFIYSIQVAGGINRYFANLISRLPVDSLPIMMTCQQHDINFPVHPRLKTWYYQRYGFRPNRISYWLEPYYFRMARHCIHADVFHPTYYTSLTRQSLRKFNIPLVLTVYDLIDELFPDYVNSSVGPREKQEALSVARAILCISENTKQDLLQHYAVPEERVFVTPLSADLDIHLSYGPETVPSRPYYLYVGNRAPYKNFDGLLRAFSGVTTLQPEVGLCVVGSPFNKRELCLLEDLKLSDTINQYTNISDAHLAKLYRCSIALVYPSLYEGFGLPLLEAMRCGTAVVAARTSSIPEIVGEAGFLFSPQHLDELIDILLFLLKHPHERERMISKGFRQAGRFSWEKTAAQTLEIYRHVVL